MVATKPLFALNIYWGPENGIQGAFRTDSAAASTAPLSTHPVIGPCHSQGFIAHATHGSFVRRKGHDSRSGGCSGRPGPRTVRSDTATGRRDTLRVTQGDRSTVNVTGHRSPDIRQCQKIRHKSQSYDIRHRSNRSSDTGSKVAVTRHLTQVTQSPDIRHRSHSRLSSDTGLTFTGHPTQLTQSPDIRHRPHSHVTYAA